MDKYLAMATDQKPPLSPFGSKNPQPPLDLEKIFNEERINLKALMDSRKLTKEINKTLAPYTGEFGDAQKKHLLKRTMVGYASRHLKDLEGLTMDQAVDLIMTPHEMGEPVNNYYHEFPPEAYKEKYGTEDVGPGEPFISIPYTRPTENNMPDEAHGNERRQAIFSWVYHNMYSQPTSISWKFFLFLHNLTPVQQFGGNKSIYAHLRLIFEGPFRSYKDFIYDLTMDPSMLEYLNLRLSRKETPDENYAREVQELFTVGKRPFSRYTESDVQAAARLLVGWDFDWEKSIYGEGWKQTPRFNPNNHDTGDKQFSEFYGNTLIQGREGEAGAEELNDFLDMIFDTQEVSIYLARRLFQFFAYPVLSEYVEQNIILPLSEILRENNFNLSEGLKALLKSEYFYAPELENALLKGPFDFAMNLHKEFDILNGDLISHNREEDRQYLSFFPEEQSYFDSKYYDHGYRAFRIFRHFGGHYNNQGMEVLNPPSVSGWKAYYQEPVYDFFWLNSVTIKAKKRITDEVSQWGAYLFDETNIRYSLDSFIKSFDTIEDLDLFLLELTDRFLGGGIPEKSIDRIKRNVLGDNLDKRYWSEAITRFKTDPSRNNYNTLFHKMREVLSQVFQLNEIHVH